MPSLFHHRAVSFVAAAIAFLHSVSTLQAGHRPQAGAGFAEHPHPASGATTLFTFGIIVLVLGMLLAFMLYLWRRARHPLEPAAHAEEFLSEERANRRPPSSGPGRRDESEWEKPPDWWKKDE